MSAAQFEKRLKALESEVARLKSEINRNRSGRSSKGWWRSIVGTFANDPLHAEAMRLGRKYRESLRPSSKRR